MNETHVQDIMVPLEEYPCIPETYTLHQAIKEMEKVQLITKRKKQATLPRMSLIFDESFRDLLGVLRRRDIMRGLEPRFLGGGALDYRRKLFDVEIDPNLSELSYEKVIAECDVVLLASTPHFRPRHLAAVHAVHARRLTGLSCSGPLSRARLASVLQFSP